MSSLASRPNTTFQDMEIAARELSPDALHAIDDAQAAIETDPDPDFPGDVGRFNAHERRRAIKAELDRRDRLVATHPGLPHPDDERYAAWRELAQLVRERVDIVEVFDRCGYHLHDVNPKEAHAACLVCGGTDRLVIRRDPPARVWCRRCDWSGDVITVAMSLRQAGFRDAVRWLAELAGFESPLLAPILDGPKYDSYRSRSPIGRGNGRNHPGRPSGVRVIGGKVVTE